MTTTPQQVFKKQKDALAYILDTGVKVSPGKFSQDCAKYHLVQPDKGILLCDLIAYLRREFNTEPTGPAKDLALDEHARQLREYELRKLKADVETKERANRKEDDRWMEVVAHETQMAAFAGQIEESLQQVTTIKLSELIFIAGGDLARAAEFAHALDRLHVAALTDAVREQVKTVVFEDEEAHGESAE